MKTYKMIWSAALSLLLAAGLASCTDDNTQDPPQERLFRPVSISGSSEANSILLRWSAIPGAAGYQIERATDAGFTKNLATVTTPDAKSSYTFTGLNFETEYFFRLTALSGSQVTDDSEPNVSKGVKTGNSPVILQPIADADKGDDWVTARWEPTVDGVTYDIVKLNISSEDGSFTFDHTLTAAEKTAQNYTFTGLQALSYIVTIYSSMDGNQIAMNRQAANLLAPLLPVDMATVTATTATLKWKSGFAVTKIVLTDPAGTAKTYNITDAAALSMPITGLNPTTRYVAQIFIGTTSCNRVAFRTWYSIPTGANVKAVATSDNLWTVLTNAADGDVLVFDSGTWALTDPVGTASFVWNKALTLIARTPTTQAVIAPAKEGTMSGTISALKFIGLQIGGSTSITYFINNPASGDLALSSLEFRDCHFTGLGSCLFRSQKTTNQTLGSIVLDYCSTSATVATAAGYNLLHLHATASANLPQTIAVTNSTFNGITGLIKYAAAINGASATATTLTNNTFYELGNTGGRYIVDYNSASLGRVDIAKCLFGSTKNNVTDYKGVRAGTVACSESYGSTAFNTAGGNSMPAPFESDYCPLSEMFKNAPGGDFTLLNANLIIKGVGDPRWIPVR